MYATVGGTEMFYTVTGTGRPFLVPSLAGTPIYERTFAPALGDRLQLIFAELRSNRTSAGDAATLTLDRLIEEMDGLRQALGLDRIGVIGHSGHSVLALAYAARFPERVSGVIVVGGMPTFFPDLRQRIAAYWDVAASPERKQRVAENHAKLTDEMLARLAPSDRLAVTYAADGPQYFYDSTYDCTPLWEGHVDFAPALHERFWGVGGQFETFDPVVSFPRISAPVFIAHGVFDFSVPATIWIGMKEKLPNPTYRAFERSGHYPQLEERTTFSRAVEAWLRRD
jgi:proline iminopeptidase